MGVSRQWGNGLHMPLPAFKDVYYVDYTENVLFVRYDTGVSEAYKILYHFYRYCQPVPILIAGNNGHSVQGLVAKVKDTVANG